MHDVVTRFLKYIRFESTSDEASATCPSTKGQIVFGGELVKELQALGLSQVEQDENGYILATLPSNSELPAPIIGFIAHLDTAPDYNGKNVNPQIIQSYQGGDILLNKEHLIYLKEKEFPELKKYQGLDLITTDGTTLLGADDKAGIAEIITALAFLLAHPEIEHGLIRIAFTPDEEIGRGADRFPVEKFGAAFAYTIDGGKLGQLEMENFNAASATFTIQGQSVHPGSAKNKMINSLLIAGEIINYFPPSETPATTENYEGFYHLHQLHGSVEKTTLKYIIRDHDSQLFADRKAKTQACRDDLNQKYGQNLVEVSITDSYLNMKEVLDQHPHVIQLAAQAMQEVGVEPILTPIRGGTDGARLSFMGLPCPNIFTGGHNFHGRYEFIPIPAMIKAVETIVKICELGISAKK